MTDAAHRHARTPRSTRWRHPALALLLPAALLGVGAWQLTRIAGQADAFAGRASRMEAAIERIQPLVARTPNAPVRFTGEQFDTTAQAALARMQEARTDFDRDVLIDRARTGAAWAAVAGGGASLVAALLCLLLTARGAARGRRSRDALVRAFAGVVRLLPALLGCVAVASSVAVLGAVLFEVGGAWFLESVDTGEIKLVVAGLMIALGSVAFAIASVVQLRRALVAFTPQPMDVLAREAPPAEAPGMWRFLGDIARRQGAAPPDHLVLGLTSGFFVTSSPVRLAPDERVLSGRTLYLPASLLPMLSAGEITAVVAHELAHFTGEDTRYSQHFLPLFDSMARNMAAVTRGPRTKSWMESVFQPTGVLAAHVLETFQHVVSHWSRMREFEADQASLRVTDREAAATALLRSGLGTEVTGAMLSEVYGRPSRASEDFVGEVLARAGALGFAEPARHLDDGTPHPTDTHPPTRARVEAFGVPVDAALLAAASRPVSETDTAFVAGLFEDWIGFRKRLGTDLLGMARENDRQYQAALEAAAGEVAAEVEVHERSAATYGTAIPAAILFGMGLFTCWVAFASGWIHAADVGVVVGTAAVLTVMGALLLWLAASRYRRRRSGPFLVLGPEGFRCLGIAGLVPWSAVRSVEVTTGNVFVTRFWLTGPQAMPEQTGYRGCVKLDRKRNQLRLQGLVPRGLKAQAYLDLLTRAVRAHHAREVLRERALEG